MPSRQSHYFRDRLAELERQWLSSPPDIRLIFERSMRLIMAMEEAILRAQDRAEKAEQRLAHAEKMLRRLDRRI